MNKVVNSYPTLKVSAVLTFIFFDNSQYKFMQYARKTIIHWSPVKMGR